MIKMVNFMLHVLYHRKKLRKGNTIVIIISILDNGAVSLSSPDVLIHV